MKLKNMLFIVLFCTMFVGCGSNLDNSTTTDNEPKAPLCATVKENPATYEKCINERWENNWMKDNNNTSEAPVSKNPDDPKYKHRVK